MMTRKPTKAQDIELMKNEIDTIEKFMEPKLREIERLNNICRERALTDDENQRVAELIEMVRYETIKLRELKKNVDSFFARKSA